MCLHSGGGLYSYSPMARYMYLTDNLIPRHSRGKDRLCLVHTVYTYYTPAISSSLFGCSWSMEDGTNHASTMNVQCLICSYFAQNSKMTVDKSMKGSWTLTSDELVNWQHPIFGSRELCFIQWYLRCNKQPLCLEILVLHSGPVKPMELPWS